MTRRLVFTVAMLIDLLLMAGVFAPRARTLGIADSLVISEVYADPVGDRDDNEFIELYNPGPGTVYLDGAVITDEGGSGTEGVYQFPGNPGETNYAVAAGAYVVIANDAVNDGTDVELSGADWEFHHTTDDDDNAGVPNIERVSGGELNLADGGDGILIADGTDATDPISDTTVIDGMNYGSPSDPAYADTSTNDGAYAPNTGDHGACYQRDASGTDTDNSDNDFVLADCTPGSGLDPTAIMLAGFVASSGGAWVTLGLAVVLAAGGYFALRHWKR